MARYKTKLGRIINFIKNEGKFKRTDFVRVMQNTSGRKEYDKYIGEEARVTNIDYEKKEYIVGLKFSDGKNYDFKACELQKLTWQQMFSSEYRKLLDMI